MRREQSDDYNLYFEVKIMPVISFMADHMLIKLGKYLRILGYDAEWNLLIRTHELIVQANAQDRVFLTRNTRLPDQYPCVKHLLTIRSVDPVCQLVEVVNQMCLDANSFLFSKCIKCNVALDQVVDKKEIMSKVHPNVYDRYETFYTCPKCHTVFWKGGHVYNTCRKLGVEIPVR